MPQAKKKTTTRKTSAKRVSQKVVEEPEVSPSVVSSSSSTWLTTKKYLRNPRVLVGLAVVIIIVALVYALRGWFIVATVNGQPITRWEFDHQLEQESGKQVLNSLVTQRLIEQYAASKNVSVNQSDIDTTVNQLSKSLQSQGQTLDSALAAQGMSKNDFMEQVRLQKLVQKLLGNSIKVSDKEVSDYIAQNKSSFDPKASQSAMESQARQQLEQQKLSDQAQALVTKLQNQAKITYFASF